jgi:hypothetical protein
MRWLLLLALSVFWTPVAFAFEPLPIEGRAKDADERFAESRASSQEVAGPVERLAEAPPKSAARAYAHAAHYAGCEQAGYSMRTTSMGAALIVIFALLRRRRTKAQLSSGRYTSQR